MAIYTLFPQKEKLGNANLPPKRATRLSNCYIRGPKQNSEYRQDQVLMLVTILMKILSENSTREKKQQPEKKNQNSPRETKYSVHEKI